MTASDPLDELTQVLTALAATIRPGSGEQTAEQAERASLRFARRLDAWFAQFLDDAAANAHPMFGPDGASARPDRITRLARALDVTIEERKILAGLAAAGIFAAHDARRSEQARADAVEQGRREVVTRVEWYAQATTHPGSVERGVLASLLVNLRARFGRSGIPDTPNVRHAGLRCRTCNTEITYDQAAADPDRCADHQPQGVDA